VAYNRLLETGGALLGDDADLDLDRCHPAATSAA